MRRRKRYLDNTAPADNTANVVRPVNRMIQVKQKDTPARREKETREYKARQELAKITPINPRQASIGPYREKTAIDKRAGEVYAFVENEKKQEEAMRNAGVVLGNYADLILSPLMASTYVDMADAYKRGKRGFWDVAGARFTDKDAWSKRHPGEALVADIAAPFALSKGTQLAKFAGRDIANSWRDMRYALAHPESQTLGIVPKEFSIPGFKMPISSKEALSKAGEQGYWNSLIDKVEELPKGETRWQAGQALDRMRRLVKNEASNTKLLSAVEQDRGQTTADDIMQFLLGRPIKYKTSTQGIERFEGSSKIPTPSRRNTYIDEPRTMHWVGDDYVPIVREKIDDIPNLRQTIETIEKNIKDKDIIPQFLDGSYISAFKNEAAQQGIDVSSLSNNSIAKILTEQYKQLSSSSTGALKNNVLWRGWGNDYPASIFDWQTHIGKSTGNLGFWGQGNYFGTGNYRGVMENRPYMITGIKQLAYDPALGPTDAAEGLKVADKLDEFNILGVRPGRADIATRWMSESPETRMVVATPDGLKNTYGILDTGEKGIEVVTQKNTGIKSLIPDFRIGNGVTFLRDWNNPNVYRSLIPLGVGYGLYKNR